jgi:hypothetical protein
MFGGTDYVFRLPPCRVGDVVDMVIRWAKRLWPNAWFETDEMDGPVPLNQGSPAIWLRSSDEFFVYEDEAAAADWTEHGATDSNGNQMLHVLVRPKYVNGTEDHVQVTVVVGELTPPVRDNLQWLQEKLQAEAASRSQWPEEVAA